MHEDPGCSRDDRGQLDDEVWPLDAVLSRWCTAPATRRGWRDALTVVRGLLDTGAWYEPAMIPGLVQARLGVALNLAGYTRRRLRGKRVLSLGSHAGLEVRMLSDWGATALGVDVNPRLVQAGIAAGLVAPGCLLATDAAAFLTRSSGPWDLVLALAPSAPDWPEWARLAWNVLADHGAMVAVAYWRDIPVDWYDTMVPCLEGTMGGRVWCRDGRPPE